MLTATQTSKQTYQVGDILEYAETVDGSSLTTGVVEKVYDNGLLKMANDKGVIRPDASTKLLTPSKLREVAPAAPALAVGQRVEWTGENTSGGTLNYSGTIKALYPNAARPSNAEIENVFVNGEPQTVGYNAAPNQLRPVALIAPAVDASAFDYTTIDDADDRAEIQAKATAGKALLKRSTQDIWELGRLLTEAKALLPHGAFGKWIEAEFEMADRTARRFMQVYDAFKSATVADLTIPPTALYELSSPAIDDETRADTVEKIKSGEIKTTGQVRAAVGKPEKPERPIISANTVDHIEGDKRLLLAVLTVEPRLLGAVAYDAGLNMFRADCAARELIAEGKLKAMPGGKWALVPSASQIGDHDTPSPAERKLEKGLNEDENSATGNDGSAQASANSILQPAQSTPEADSDKDVSIPNIDTQNATNTPESGEPAAGESSQSSGARDSAGDVAVEPLFFVGDEVAGQTCKGDYILGVVTKKPFSGLSGQTSVMVKGEIGTHTCFADRLTLATGRYLSANMVDLEPGQLIAWEYEGKTTFAVFVEFGGKRLAASDFFTGATYEPDRERLAIRRWTAADRKRVVAILNGEVEPEPATVAPLAWLPRAKTLIAELVAMVPEMNAGAKQLGQSEMKNEIGDLEWAINGLKRQMATIEDLAESTP